MKTTVTISNRGAIKLPVKLRRALGLKPDDPLIAEVTHEGLLLRPAVTLPVEFYTPERIREFDNVESDLTAFFARKAPHPKRAFRSARKTTR